jgi:O-acetylhomoserine/O-acetylserine sulfhydrylase-like pyridoxal-dependent enzyme
MSFVAEGFKSSYARHTCTLIIDAASTTHRRRDESHQRTAGVRSDMVRILVGL